MATFLLRRLAGYTVLVFAAVSLAYLLAAGSLDPRTNFAGRNPAPPPRVVAAQLSAYNLNDETPLAQRYTRWLAAVARGDFGRTWEGESINAEMSRRIGVSLRLLLLGTVLGSVGGIAIGALAAARQYRLSDRAITLLSFGVLSVPVFVLAVFFQTGGEWLNTVTGVRIFEWVGEYAPSTAASPVAELGSRLQHLVLPTLTIALAQIAVYSRYQRMMMLDVLGADYVRTAMAKGMRRREALVKHALRTALIPVATYFAYSFGLLLTGATFTEKIFGWHGMGEWLVDSINRNDVNAVAAISCCAAVGVLAAGLLSDVAYAVLDPRVRVLREECDVRGNYV
jgi:ABC-type dipeptide/oligopeptide/nickel transport system permease component